MSSEFLEKIRNIIVTLFVLFFSFLIAWTAFCTLPVKAASSDYPGQALIYSNGNGNKFYLKYTCLDPLNKVTDPVSVVFDDNELNSSKLYGIMLSNVVSYSSGVTSGTLGFYEYDSASDSWSSISVDVKTGLTSSVFYESEERYGIIETNLPVFISSDGDISKLINYFRTLDDSDSVNKKGGSIDNPDFQDTAYAFTGFSMSGKTASWTGTTERSYLLDMDVEEWVNYTYGFATSEDQEVSSFIDAEAHYPTSDKKLTLPWDEMEANKKEGEFIRQVNIIPCYGTSGAGFYFGSPVYVYFDVNGKVESIVQNSVPTDGEVIGNNISLIGFRYDTSFHAEFVDVWSNAVNCSAFDLGGSQYLSLGVKALYYNGQSKDIDFVSLDRKNLVWDKTFDSFKSFNGSGIKQLFFTPYIKTGVNNPWNKGNSIVIDFDVNGNATSSFDTGDDGTVHLSDFKLTGVVWNKPMLAYGTITWTGTTANSDMSIVPDSDTLVVCSYPVYDSSLNESYETYDTVTIGKGSIRVYIDSLIDKYSNAGKTWNGEMWLTPCYKKGGVLYMGEPVIVNCTKGTVSDIEVDESTGTANQVDKTDENKSYADAILSSGNNFFSIVKGLIASMQQFPELIATLFSFLPGWVNSLIAGSIFVIFVCRILGR